MKHFAASSQILMLCLSICALDLGTRAGGDAAKFRMLNVIEGVVYDPNRRPVPDLWIELQNEFNMTYGRIRSSASGRFSFPGVRAGHYIIRVYTTGTNFQEATESVDVVNVVQNSSDVVYQDVNLRYRKSANDNGFRQLTGSLFAQNVPDEARDLYKRGIKDLTDKEIPKGRGELEQAIKVFPDYFDALNALGLSYVETKEYQSSFPYLIHSIDVNQRSFSSFYGLAYAAYQMNRLPEAGEAARGAVIIEPDSINANLLYGTILRTTGNHDKALEVLLKAAKLTKRSPIAEVHWQLALLYNKLNRNTEAANELETYLKIAPDAANRPQVEALIRKLREKPTS
jgi:tetratricopeptide (TPR) repeat protein